MGSIRHFYLVLLLVVGALSKNGGDKNRTDSRTAKNMFLLPFVKVVVPPDPCGPNTGGTFQGTTQPIAEGVCIPRGKCGQFKDQGTRLGDCKMGLGECCKYTATCNSTVREVDIVKQVTTITSNQAGGCSDCTYRIRRGKGICGIKLDFLTYVSAQADDDGICTMSSLTIRGSKTVPDGFQTCGTLTGQHMYLAFDSDVIEIRPSICNIGFQPTVAPPTSPNTPIAPVIPVTMGMYQIVVTQIGCVSHMRVPDYCLQYYNESRSTIRSFDFGKQQQSNQEYTICLGTTAPSSIATITPCANPAPARDAFEINGNSADQALVQATCSNMKDWIQLNGADKLCAFLPGTMVQSQYHPHTINVHFTPKELIALPFFDEVLATPATMCTDFGIALHLQTLYTGCQVVGSPPRCFCGLQPQFKAVFGEADLLNPGFCLDYFVK